MGKIPGAGSLNASGKCVVCGEPYSIAIKAGPKKPIPYTKGNKSGYAHTECVKRDKANAPEGGGK